MYLKVFFLRKVNGLNFFFLAVLGLQKNSMESTEFPYKPVPANQVSPVNILHWCGTFVIIDESVLVHYF